MGFETDPQPTRRRVDLTGPPPKDLLTRTKRFALAVIKLYGALPRRPVAQTLGRQLLDAGTSPGAQYREAQRAKSSGDFVSKIEVGSILR
jgi:four helix bundle protein